MLDLMGLDHHSVMVIHGGGVYGDKEGTIKRWCENFYRLPKRVQKRLVIENCEKSYSVEDCLRISDMVNIPVVFDTHHYDIHYNRTQITALHILVAREQAPTSSNK